MIALLVLLVAHAVHGQWPTWKTLFDGLELPPKQLQGWSQSQIEAVHRYFAIQRWNSRSDIGRRYSTNYAEAAEKLKIHVEQLKAADTYVHYTRMGELTKRIRQILSSSTEVAPDHYHPIEETAYCGTYTLHLHLAIVGCRDDPAVGQRAKELATELTSKVPAEIDGFKITEVTYHCTPLGTKGSTGIAFLWRRGGKVKTMQPSDGTYGMMLPEEAPHWHQTEWNDGKKLKPIALPPLPTSQTATAPGTK